MREIKFRAWDKKDNRMITHEQDFIPLKVTSIGVLKLNPHTEYDSFYLLPLDRFELMQFTGLHESCNENPKDNREIYDGDIIEFLDGSRLQVKWNDDICQWQYSDGSPLHNAQNYGIYRRIVGNIYEHPELTP